MRYINLGLTNIKVSVIAFGAWAIGGRWWGGTDVQDSIDAINKALESGVNFIDTAPAYGLGLSEEIVGKAIKERKRDDIVIATKCGMVWHTDKNQFWYKYDDKTNLYKNLTADSIKYELENSLKRLGTDYIDLYQTHIQDPDTPIADTMSALLELKKQGKIRAIGVSNATIEDLKNYNAAGTIDSDQEKYSILDNEPDKEILPWCNASNVTFLAYSPLSQGLLTGKIKNESHFKGDDIRIGNARFSQKNIDSINDILDKKIKPFADKKGVSVTQLAISWVTSHTNTVALCGARNARQAEENAGSGDLLLTKEDIIYINTLFKNLK